MALERNRANSVLMIAPAGRPHNTQPQAAAGSLVRAIKSCQASGGARRGVLGPDGAGRLLFLRKSADRTTNPAKQTAGGRKTIPADECW